MHNSAVDESTSTDDEDCDDHKKLKEVKVGELQIGKEKIVIAALLIYLLL